MITIFQHGEDEEPGIIREFLNTHRIPWKTCRFYKGDNAPYTLPEHLILLGGSMSVNNAEDYPYFAAEKAIVREMIKGNRPVLGICLGAQLIASASGQPVRKGPREIGWASINGCVPEWRGVFPETFPVFQWHEETFNLPPGSTLLAKGHMVKNQAFRLGSAVGVQFHPEVTEKIIATWARDVPDDVKRALLEESDRMREENRARCNALLSLFLRGWTL